MNTIPQDEFTTSLINAYGSTKDFENELISKAYENKNKGNIYFKINNHLNFNLSSKPSANNEYILLTCNLDIRDIYNFISDIDYNKLSNAYYKIRNLINSK